MSHNSNHPLSFINLVPKSFINHIFYCNLYSFSKMYICDAAHICATKTHISQIFVKYAHTNLWYMDTLIEVSRYVVTFLDSIQQGKNVIYLPTMIVYACCEFW